jgi:hypothetical protein
VRALIATQTCIEKSPIHTISISTLNDYQSKFIAVIITVAHATLTSPGV